MFSIMDSVRVPNGILPMVPEDTFHPALDVVSVFIEPPLSLLILVVPRLIPKIFRQGTTLWKQRGRNIPLMDHVELTRDSGRTEILKRRREMKYTRRRLKLS